MTEKSYFFNGVTRGDANQAPYSLQVYTKLFGLAHATEGAYVVNTTITNGFAVTAGAGLTVSVATGTILVNGIACTRGIVSSLTIPTNPSTYPRMDRVIVRVVYNSTGGLSSARLAIKNGIPSASPNPPELTQDYGTIYEVSLARIYVPSGAAAVSSYYIFDEREFIEDTETINLYSSDNIFRNSEFIAGAGTGDEYVSTVYAGAPAEWRRVNNAFCKIENKFSPMNRGTGVFVQCNTTGDNHIKYNHTVQETTDVPYTLRFLMQVHEGTAYISIDDGGSYILRVEPSDDIVEVIIRTTGQSLTLVIGNNSAGYLEFTVGQCTLAYGHVGAPYLPKQETLVFGAEIHHPDYNPGFVGIGSFTLEDIDNFGPGITQLLAKLDYNDSASAGTATSYASLTGPSSVVTHLIVNVGRLPNSTYRTMQNWIRARKVDVGLAGTTEDIHTNGSAAGSENLYISFIGCTT